LLSLTFLEARNILRNAWFSFWPFQAHRKHMAETLFAVIAHNQNAYNLADYHLQRVEKFE
jgi:hypothetical protein